MPTWLKRVRATLGMGLLWAAGGMGVGGVIELLDNVLPGGLAMASRVDMWPQTLAIPGFIGGVLFAVVLMIAARVQRFDELSMPRFAAWGAVAGLALGVIAMAIGAPIMFLGIMSLAGTVAGAGSLLIARRASSPTALPSADDDAPELRP